MVRLITSFLLFTILFSSGILAGDLYRVTVKEKADFELLASMGIDPVLRTQNGYLVLTTEKSSGLFENSGLEKVLIATGIDRSRLALDGRLDRANVAEFPLLFEEDNLRLYQVDVTTLAVSTEEAQLFPVGDFKPDLEYKQPVNLNLDNMLAGVDLDSLISLVELDSLQSYTERLQAFNRRTAGSDSNHVARDWLYDKLESFGYDSVILDDFEASLSGTLTECYNVAAYKIGTRYPGQHIIIGAHFDAVAASPGADDNGSGTAGVLEIARILKDIETELTIVFILFDAEEFGLYGSYHYVNLAEARGDSIIYMLNMDMIGHYENTNLATLYYGSDNTYSQLWQTLADSLVDVYGVLSGSSSGSDHYPFAQKGYDVTFIIENTFSTVYHTYRDSTTYMSFDYMTKLVKASLATAYTVNQTFEPQPALLVDFSGEISYMLAPNQANSFDVTVTPLFDGDVVPGSPTLHYSVDGGAYETAALVKISAGLYEATLPEMDCDSRCEYYLSAEEVTNGMFYNPDPNFPILGLIATEKTIFFEDDFETDKGWTVSGGATDGHWDRGVPAGGGLRGDPLNDYDGSGQCYLTDNVAGNSDVDGGTTILTSPVFNLGTQDARISFALWYSNNFGAAPFEDILYIYLSNDNGDNWSYVMQVGPEERAGGDWYEYELWVSEYLTPTNEMKIAFSVTDDGSGSVVEAALDAFVVAAYECTPIIPCCIGYTGNSNCSEEQEPDISDITRLIDYLYLSHEPLCCPEEADANGSGGEPDISDITRLIDYLYLTHEAMADCP